MAQFHIYNQTVADGTATSVVRPSDWNSVHSNLVTLSGNTAGVSTVSGTNIVYQGGSNVVVSGVQGANAATVIFSGSNQSVQTQASGNIAGIGYTSTTQAGSTVGATHNTAGLSMAWPPFLTTAQPAGAYLTTARASNDAVGLATAQTNVTWTVNSAGLSLNAGGYAGTTTGFTGANISGSMTHNTAGLALSLSVAAGGGGGAINVSAGTTSGNLQTIVFSNSNGVSFGLNGSTVTASAAGGGGGAYTQAFFQPELYGSSLTSTLANGTVYIRPFELNSPIDADKYMFQAAYTTLTSTRSLSGGASGVLNIGATGSYGMTGTVLMMSRVNTNETNASYNSIVSFDSKTFSMGNGYTFSQSQSTNVSSATVSYSSTYGASFIQNIGSDGGFTTTAITASSTGSFSSTSTGAGTFGSSISLSAPNAYFSGIRPWFVPGSGTNMPGGEYWIGLIITTNTGSTGSYSLNAAVQLSAPAIQFMTASTNNYLEIGNSVPFTTSNWRPGFGSISATASSLTSGNIALSQISNMASNASMYFAIQGQTK